MMIQPPPESIAAVPKAYDSVVSHEIVTCSSARAHAPSAEYLWKFRCFETACFAH